MPLPPDRNASPMPGTTAQARRHVLAKTVAMHIARGARVESQTDFEAVLARGLRLHKNHGLTITGGERFTVLAVDEHGTVTVRRI